MACQLDLELLLPGETDDIGRFEKLEQVLESLEGISEVHLRRDMGTAEVCIHYDHEKLPLNQVLALVRSSGASVSDRYREQTWFVRGMDCAQCGFVIEHALGRLRGVLSANVAYAAERLKIEYDRQTLNMREVETRINALGYVLESTEQGHACSHHQHGGGLAPRLEVPLSIASGVLLTTGFLLEMVVGITGFIPTALYILALISGGCFALRDAFNSVRQLRFDIETLMVLAALGAGALGAWFEGAFLLFLFSMGHALEHRAMQRARGAIGALSKLRPEVARVRRGAELIDIPVRDVLRGDRVVVRAGDRVPLDGRITEGRSSLDQAAITGESLPVARAPGEEIYAGTINLDAQLEIEVTRLSGESVLARVIDMVSVAEAQKSPAQRFSQKVEQRVVPIILVMAGVLPVVLVLLGTPLREAVLRALSLLVAASPCALAISTPAAVLSAVARAAHSGVLIKGGAHLDVLGRVRTLAFDKTGTLTLGRPKLVSVTPADGVTPAELLGTAGGVEALSSHPLARAVVEGAAAHGVALLEASGSEAVHGKGLRSSIEGERVEVGSLSLFDGVVIPATIQAEVDRLEAAGQTTMVVRRTGRFLGVLGVADTVRPESKATLSELRALGIRRMVMLSGDNARVARAISTELGMDEPRAPLMPEEKVRALREFGKDGGVAMVGDGVNDAPALAAASVGIAMGGVGSDVALETADIVLMGDDLRKLPFAVGLARASTRVVKQNLVISLGVSAILIVASILGLTRIGQAVILHEGSTLLVVANGLRLLRYRSERGKP